MAKKKDKGHEAEACGYRIVTEPCTGGWSVIIYDKPRALRGEGGKFAELPKPKVVIERDGFDYEGPALDWGIDWATEHRPYTIEIKAAEKGGHVGQVLNDHGFDEYTTRGCEDEDEAKAVCEAWIAARRRHDLAVIAERRKVRANARLLEADMHAAEQEALGAIDAAKGILKKVEKEREQLRRDLEAPQIEFNFVAELERQKVQALRGLGSKQTDLVEHLETAKAANAPGTTKARDAARRSRQSPEAPTP